LKEFFLASSSLVNFKLIHWIIGGLSKLSLYAVKSFYWSNIKIPFLVRHRWSIDGLVVYWSTTGEPLSAIGELLVGYSRTFGKLLVNLWLTLSQLLVKFESTFGQL